MAIGVVAAGYALFATFVLRPWLTKRLQGRPIPKLPMGLALTIIVVSGVVASPIGQAVHSVIAGLLAYAVAASVLGTALILRAASRQSR